MIRMREGDGEKIEARGDNESYCYYLDRLRGGTSIPSCSSTRIVGVAATRVAAVVVAFLRTQIVADLPFGFCIN